MAKNARVASRREPTESSSGRRKAAGARDLVDRGSADEDRANEPAGDRSSDRSVDQAGDPGDAQRAETGVAAREIGGRKGPDPVRYGDWEKNGRCIDF